jgi:ABC-type cobalt transport system substrate-binding protein
VKQSFRVSSKSPSFSPISSNNVSTSSQKADSRQNTPLSVLRHHFGSLGSRLYSPRVAVPYGSSESFSSYSILLAADIIYGSICLPGPVRGGELSGSDSESESLLSEKGPMSESWFELWSEPWRLSSLLCLLASCSGEGGTCQAAEIGSKSKPRGSSRYSSSISRIQSIRVLAVVCF